MTFKEMKNKKYAYTFFALVLVVGVAFGVLTSGAAMASGGRTDYPVNQNGETYGSVETNVHPDLQDYPDLIAAIGEDGVVGYVRKTELDGEQPKNPEEASRYMERLDAAREAAKAAGQEYLRYIPVYEEDGVTVIGRFGVDYLWSDEPFYEHDVK